ncbi:MAG: glycosyltransferase [Solirubrobacterales bacterium]
MIAYLCSEYPAISHTFVLREVEALRQRNLEIATFTIRRTNPERLLSEADRREAARTVSILPPRWGRLLAAHMKLLARSPRAYLATLAFSLGLARPGARGRLWQLFYFAEAGFLWNECHNRGIRHIHAHLANAAADIAMLTAHLGSNLGPGEAWSWSFTMHGPTEFFDLRHYRLAEKLSSARFVICISDFARSQLMALAEPKAWSHFHVVHMGVPVETFTPAKSANTIANIPNILYVGRLVPEKGQAVLLEAVALLATRGHEISVTLVGDGALRPDLERRAEQLGLGSTTSFLGAVGQDEIRNLYERASIFCLPSFAEGVPVVLMEAMAMGVPVISTRIAGIPELVEDGQSGFLVSPGRADELADRLEKLLADPLLCQRLGRAGRDKILQDFDAQMLATQLSELFSQELADNSPLQDHAAASNVSKARV